MQTTEFLSFYAFLQVLQVRAWYDEYNSSEMHEFMNRWRVQYVKTRVAQANAGNSLETLEQGKGKDRNTVVEVDDEEWSELNEEYYKLR